MAASLLASLSTASLWFQEANLRKWIWFILAGLISVPAFAQNDALNGFCHAGGRHATVQGLNATNFQQFVIPSCTVTVYLTGTTTKATIYSNVGGTVLANPFTANAVGAAAPGQWLFYAATGVGYDVVMSGGIAPNTYPQPVTLTDLIVGGGGGGSGCIGNATQIAYFPSTDTCVGDTLFSDLGIYSGTGPLKGLIYTGDGINATSSNAGNYIFNTTDPFGISGSNVAFNMTGNGGQSGPNFNVHMDTSSNSGPQSGGFNVNNGNIKLYTTGSSTNGNNIYLTALADPVASSSGGILLEATGHIFLHSFSNVGIDISAEQNVRIVSGSSQTTFSGGLAPSTRVVTEATYNIGSSRETTDYFNASGSSIAASLPASAWNDGSLVFLKKIDSTANAVTITPGAGTIDGASNYILSTQYQSVLLQFDNSTTNWHVLATNGAGGGGAVSSVANSDGSLTVSPTTGAVVASLNTSHANTWTTAQTFSGAGIPIATGTTSNTDLAGFITLSGGTGTYTFTATYASAPVCVVSETTDATKTVKGSTSTTVLTITGTGTDVIAYLCIGRT